MLKKQCMAMAVLFLMLGLTGCPANKDDTQVDTKGSFEQSSEAKPQEGENPFQTNEKWDDKKWDDKKWDDKKAWDDEKGWDDKKAWDDEKGWDDKKWDDEKGWDDKKAWDDNGKEWPTEKK